MSNIVPMGEQKLGASNNRERVAAALQRIDKVRAPAASTMSTPASGSAVGIAHAIGDAVGNAVKGAIPYGRSIDLELDVAHRGADGSATTARLRVTCGSSR
ncbi:hypothetical protein [Bradyrhizobium glycinis]|uniref:hypothetical protein n=1 Tax=Bradyrhizobium glycinis TaxID=2751812 RepID=UPI0018D5E541|nr:hypothetical protein [Bradyrhizobium glycinis]MBH5372953.1 hypothetical protein [Bradyrhizobium glycinis]